jgi:hypothetical protein
MKTYLGVEIQLDTFLTSALDGGEWSASRPGRFTPKERACGTHWIGGSVDSRAVLDAVVKRKIPSPRRESNPRTPVVQKGKKKTGTSNRETAFIRLIDSGILTTYVWFHSYKSINSS